MRKTIPTAICCLATVMMAMITSSASGQLVVGDSIGIDFGTTGTVFGMDSGVAPAAGTNFNEFNTQTADGATATAGALIKLDGTSTTEGLSVTNNSGKDSGLTGISGTPGPAPFDDPTIGGDNYGGANVGNTGRADFGTLAVEDTAAGIEAGNFVLTISGLDDGLVYEVSGGYLNSNPSANFDTIWDIDGQSATTSNASGLPDAGYITLSNLGTDGSGNLVITVTRTTQLFIGGLTIEATGVATDALCGDVNLSTTVDFADIAPFISLLSTGTFQAEADCNEDGFVTFADIAPFINALAGA